MQASDGPAWPLADRPPAPGPDRGETTESDESSSTSRLPAGVTARHAVFGILIGVMASNFLVLLWLLADGDVLSGELPTMPLWVLAMAQAGLWIGLGGVPWWLSRTKGTGNLATDFGLRFGPRDALAGLGIGVGAQLVAIPALYYPIFKLIGDRDLSEPARELTSRTSGVGLVALGFVIVIGAPVVEELFFRGLLQGIARRRFGPPAAIAISSVIFGAIHLQVVQLPALILFGVVAGVLAERTGHLGRSVWAHVGFNAVTFLALAWQVV